jgi:hypothetical protein
VFNLCHDFMAGCGSIRCCRIEKTENRDFFSSTHGFRKQRTGLVDKFSLSSTHIESFRQIEIVHINRMHSRQRVLGKQKYYIVAEFFIDTR